jgi:hypothetical protein
MTVKHKYGKYYESRGSNKKYPQLNDIDAVMALFEAGHCPADAAKILKVPANSLKHLIDNDLTAEERAKIPWKRLNSKRRMELG